MLSLSRKPRHITGSLAIIGNGLACQRLLDELVQRKFAAHIDVYSDEPVPGYNRILLSSLLAGDIEVDALTARDQAWYAQHNICLHLSARVLNIATTSRLLHLHDGRVASFDQLIIATGSQAIIPTIPGASLPGVVAFRNLADTHYLLKNAHQGGKVLVVGGGLLGIEAATALAKQGMQVTLLQRDKYLMNRQLDAVAASILESALTKRAIRVITGREILALSGEQRVRGAQLDDDSYLDCNLVVFAIGIKPNLIPGTEQSIPSQRGYLVNAQLATQVPHVFALGECIELNGNTYGLVAPIWQQASVLADNLTGTRSHFTDTPYVTQLKVSGMDVHSMGDLTPHPANESLLLQDPERGIYKHLILREQRLVGALLVGDVSDSPWYFELLQSQQNLRKVRQWLVFGKAWCVANKTDSTPQSTRLESAA